MMSIEESQVDQLIKSLVSKVGASKVIEILEKENKIQQDTIKYPVVKGLYENIGDCEKVFKILLYVTDIWSINKDMYSVRIKGADVTARGDQSSNYFMKINTQGVIKVYTDDDYKIEVNINLTNDKIEKINNLGYGLISKQTDLSINIRAENGSSPLIRLRDNSQEEDVPKIVQTLKLGDRIKATRTLTQEFGTEEYLTKGKYYKIDKINNEHICINGGGRCFSLSTLGEYFFVVDYFPLMNCRHVKL